MIVIIMLLMINSAEDTVAPTITDCPPDVIVNVEEGSLSAQVSWDEPSATDASGDVTVLLKTHLSGDKFGIGSNTVFYIFADQAKNMAFCSFSVQVISGK